MFCYITYGPLSTSKIRFCLSVNLYGFSSIFFVFFFFWGGRRIIMILDWVTGVSHMETWFICVNDMWAHARACAYGGLCPHLRPPFILVRKGPKIVLGPCENKRVSNLPFICPIIYNDCICYQIDDALLAQNVNVMNRGCTCVSITSKLLASTHIGYGLWISFASVTLSRMMNLPILYSKMNSLVSPYMERTNLIRVNLFHYWTQIYTIIVNWQWGKNEISHQSCIWSLFMDLTSKSPAH